MLATGSDCHPMDGFPSLKHVDTPPFDTQNGTPYHTLIINLASEEYTLELAQLEKLIVSVF